MRFLYYKIKKIGWILTFSLFFLLVLIVLDRFYKFLAVNGFLNQPIEIVGDFLKLSFVKNYYIAFSLPITGWWLNLFIILIILILAYHFLNLLVQEEYNHTVALLAVIFGASSNLFDRLKYGYVIDYIDLKYWTVFNLADVMIVGGVVILGWLLIKAGK